jgi:hypothetical protein
MRQDYSPNGYRGRQWSLYFGAFAATCLQVLLGADKSAPDPLKCALSLRPAFFKTTGSETVKKFEVWMEAANQHSAPLRYQVQGVGIAINKHVVFVSGKPRNGKFLIGGSNIDVSALYEEPEVLVTIIVKLQYGELGKPFVRSISSARACKVKLARVQGNRCHVRTWSMRIRQLAKDEPIADANLFRRLLRAMATGKPLGKPKAKAGTSAKARDEGCDDTQTPKGTSASASKKPKRKSR